MRSNEIIKQEAIVFGSGAHQESYLRLTAPSGNIVWYEFDFKGWMLIDDDDVQRELEVEYQEVLNAGSN